MQPLYPNTNINRLNQQYNVTLNLSVSTCFISLHFYYHKTYVTKVVFDCSPLDPNLLGPNDLDGLIEGLTNIQLEDFVNKFILCKLYAPNYIF